MSRRYDLPPMAESDDEVMRRLNEDLATSAKWTWIAGCIVIGLAMVAAWLLR